MVRGMLTAAKVQSEGTRRESLRANGANGKTLAQCGREALRPVWDSSTHRAPGLL